MALTPTKIVPLNFKAPDFTLPDTLSGNSFTLNQLKGEKATVVMFICNHCPYVKHIIEFLPGFANSFLDKGVKFIAMSSNDVDHYPDDAPDKMKILAREYQFPFPYLYDESQDVARAYHAECTPDFAIFDMDLLCVYRGQLDDSRPGNDITVTGEDIANALNAIIKDQPISTPQKPSIGCNIKWKQA